MEPIDVRVKAASAWGGVGVAKWLEAIGITSWSDAAAMLAFLYTLALLGDWAWKKFKSREK